MNLELFGSEVEQECLGSGDGVGILLLFGSDDKFDIGLSHLTFPCIYSMFLHAN